MERGRVWVLEDSPLEAELARRALSSEQDVELFNDGSVLLERAARGAKPDVVVIDWQLPGISGVDVCRVIRTTDDAMSVPILMLTSQGRKEAIVEALAAGANDYVTKPYDVSELVARVATLVRTSHLQSAQKRRSRQLALAADVGEALTTATGIAATAHRCAEALQARLEASVVEIWTHDEGDLTLSARIAKGSDTIPTALVRAVGAGAPALNEGPPGPVALPLVVHGETIGVVAVKSALPRAEASAGLGTVASLLALGFARARVEGERAQMSKRERSARAEAEAANLAKDEFLAMVSHELRTPLNAITGWTRMLLTDQIDPARAKRALDTIDRNARAQARLIDDLLDISRIVSGKLHLDIGAVDVAATAELAVESLRLAAEAKKIELTTSIDPGAGHIKGDAARLQQIVGNLLSNAIKFTSSGGHVSLDVKREGERVVVLVKDDGQGIAPDFLPYVFDRFRQADGTLTRLKGGLGLGLAIARHIVDLHGGSIEAASEGLGRGAMFRVTLPVDMQLDAAAARLREARNVALERPRDIEGLRVLVVDDEPDARELMRELLESCKMIVTTAANATEAFSAIRDLKHDVVLSDLAMPGEDGLTFIARVRALPREEGGRIPAVALTGLAGAADRARVLRAGFTSHLPKPVEPNELFAVLSSVAAAR